MEKLSGSSFHIYVLDYDHDGYFDLALPNIPNNTLVYLRNPGSPYWRKLSQLVYAQVNKAKQQTDLRNLEKWQQHPIVTSAFSDSIRDFLFVNIDSEDKLVVIILS